MNRLTHMHYLLLLYLISGCDLQEAPVLIVKPEPNGYMKAVINGEDFVGQTSPLRTWIWANGSIRVTEQDSLVQLSASYFDETRPSPVHEIRFDLLYKSNQTYYSVIRSEDEHGHITGGYYRVHAVDVLIARYYPVVDSINTFTVKIKKDKGDRLFAEGVFTMQMLNSSGNASYSHEPDTVLITNGKYRIPLNDISNPRNK